MSVTNIDLGELDRKNKPRNPLIAFLLGFLPGLGQLYNGQLKKAVFYFVGYYTCLIIAGLCGTAFTFYGFIILTLVDTSFRLFLMIEAAVTASKRQIKYEPKPFNTWYYHLLAAFGVMLVWGANNFFNVLGVSTFIIPSPSSEPTLLVGDRIVVNTRAYNNEDIAYGDMVVYIHNGHYVIHRVIGLPGDELDILANNPVINGRVCAEKLVSEVTHKEGEFDPGDEFGSPIKKQLFTQVLPNGHSYSVYKTPRILDTSFHTMKGIRVPAGHYFIMGDNRDNALDSRYEGPVPKDSIVGKALFTYWGKTRGRINIDLTNQ
ncbi:signal peptidase I [uncultured Chitinophaga sp.]|uniref:signal peptidase I n=1 Tax=uncultured Chitinophaga sp. TaxID=339340 RepID=UPI0025EEEFB0|nr:signal peptidase I [uncultured Chitinophaga sp.]